MAARIHLSFAEIVKYMGGHMDSRCVLEGEAVLNAGLVVLVGTRAKKEHSLSIFALVLQTSGLTKDPLQISGELKVEEADVTVNNFKCTCKAGMSGRCKHTGAVLWYLNRNDIDDLEQLSSTDVKCLWSGDMKAAMKIDYAPRRITDFCHVGKPPAAANPFSPDFLRRAREILIDASPGSALSLHREGRARETIPETHMDVCEDDSI